MNGYFQIVNEESQMSVMLYPATDGGEELDITEVADYLTQKDIPYDLMSLYATAKKLDKEPFSFTLQYQKGRAVREMLKTRIADDNMSATVRFYAPSNDGEVMDKAEICNDLKQRGIVFGVDESVIENFIAKREYCRDYVVAYGREMERGKDASVEYFFNVDTKARPTLQEDGSVDFFHLNTINHCSKGDVLAKLLPEVPAVPGKNVRGETIPGNQTKRKRLSYGKNVALSEDETQLTALVSGHIILEDEKVSVSDVLELNNVDNSTGNIDYAGSVEVAGSVCENFSLRAGGNVIVKGVVEGALVDAEGDIIIARGMNGMGKGRIIAGGNVVAKFFENATVLAGGYVDADSILHSEVKAKDAVHVGGKRGFITGGKICATNGVEVKNLGSNMGADTVVEIGADPSVKKQVQDLQLEIQEGNKAIKMAYPVLQSASEKLAAGGSLPEDQYTYVRGVYQLYQMKREEVKKASKRLDELQCLLENTKNAAVKVSGDVYAGTRIVIGDVSMVVKEKLSYCRFVKDKGDVRMKAL